MIPLGTRVIVDGHLSGSVEARQLKPRRYLVLLDSDEAAWYYEYRVAQDGQMNLMERAA